ncbi:ATP-binding protein [Nitrosococcus watsonii]|uniref:ATP-binding protein n=1 Tax=Nitrosococcus watsonii TaxID=473531 RepID=UPI0002FAD43B|nr:ATP-binding protein [Nitrosococcus watsonii]
MVSLRDTGVGFEPTLTERIFDPFFTTKSQGLGVGLTISRSIIEARHGRLWAISSPDQGTILNFTLPVVRAD